MSDNTGREPMLEMFIFETLQLIEQLENSVLSSEKRSTLESSTIHEIFRIMHTIKGSAAMMLFHNISTLAHAIEDLFYYIREEKPKNVNNSKLTDIVLEGIDFIKIEMSKIENNLEPDGDPSALLPTIESFLYDLKQSNPSKNTASKNEGSKDLPSKQKYYISYTKPSSGSGTNTFKAVVFFEDGCELENIRAFTLMHNLKEIAEDIHSVPEDILDSDESCEYIRQHGFEVILRSEHPIDELRSTLLQTPFLKNLDLVFLDDDTFVMPSKNKKEIRLDDDPPIPASPDIPLEKTPAKDVLPLNTKQSVISVNVSKLDNLMDLVGELVIAEAMVTQNPELHGLPLSNFYKAARQLRKITGELQDTVMSIRMVPLSVTFQKMNRIVRDMSKKLKKEVTLEIIGEETEVDKNIIENISDPLMHLIRNSLDHGIESSEQRLAKGKPEKGKITLEAKNAGGDVWIIVKDDGRGLNKDKILEKAIHNGLITPSERELTDREIYSLIFLPGFSTKEKVTEFSGRGVGMDVVAKNIEKIGGTVLVDSTLDQGTIISVKIPLTLAIIDGMTIKVGNSRYTIPTISIRESFRPREEEIIKDPDGNEMIMLRGQCQPILRLHQFFKVHTEVTRISEGIIIVVENESKSLCILADELLGEQQVVVKALPNYIKNVQGLAGCTLLGDGSISLIIDISGLINNF